MNPVYLQTHNLQLITPLEYRPYTRSAGMHHLGHSCLSAVVADTELDILPEQAIISDCPEVIAAILKATEHGKLNRSVGQPCINDAGKRNLKAQGSFIGLAESTLQ